MWAGGQADGDNMGGTRSHELQLPRRARRGVGVGDARGDGGVGIRTSERHYGDKADWLLHMVVNA